MNLPQAFLLAPTVRWSALVFGICASCASGGGATGQNTTADSQIGADTAGGGQDAPQVADVVTAKTDAGTQDAAVDTGDAFAPADSAVLSDTAVLSDATGDAANDTAKDGAADAADIAATDVASSDAAPDQATDTAPPPDAAKDVAADAGFSCCATPCAANTMCVDGKGCFPKPGAGACWHDSDCASTEKCQGAFACPCTADCNIDYAIGKCVVITPVCTCDGKACTADQACLAEKKVCVPAAPVGTCWTNVDCPAGSTCDGANICPCGSACFAADKPGTCSKPPAPEVCACGGKPCAADQVCAGSGVCKSNGELKSGQCWSDANCTGKGKCMGANICPCGAMCLVADKPGTCVTSG